MMRIASTESVTINSNNVNPVCPLPAVRRPLLFVLLDNLPLTTDNGRLTTDIIKLKLNRKILAVHG